ncbi:hypothetical protein, partial [Klebsiella pneumoniae]|uniref:hypothetical protein n=1 Tax=Klebsiella pneumoniae TaxID=573 RepID=UPI003013AFC7
RLFQRILACLRVRGVAALRDRDVLVPEATILPFCVERDREALGELKRLVLRIAKIDQLLAEKH